VDKALAINLVNYRVEPEELLEFSRQKARELLVCGPQAIATCKQLFLNVSNMTIEEAYQYTAELIANLRISEEAQEGMQAFLEKRKPSWQKN
jgi:methylglutaconyl-CoA hydratase